VRSEEREEEKEEEARPGGEDSRIWGTEDSRNWRRAEDDAASPVET